MGIRIIRGYLKTFRQYASSPKTQYEYKHYALFLLMMGIVVFFLWGGIYLYDG